MKLRQEPCRRASGGSLEGGEPRPRSCALRASFRIAVVPAPAGWRLESDGQFEPLVFRSGRHAELQARSLARRMAEAGNETTVEIYDRSAALVGVWRCYGRDPGAPAEAWPKPTAARHELLWLAAE